MSATLVWQSGDGQKTLEFVSGQSLLAVLTAAGVAVPSPCDGQGSCGHCRVRVLSGGELLTPFTAREEEHLGSIAKITHERLACQAVLLPAVVGQVVCEPVD
jgi:ferredoxin